MNELEQKLLSLIGNVETLTPQVISAAQGLAAEYIQWHTTTSWVGLCIAVVTLLIGFWFSVLLWVCVHASSDLHSPKHISFGTPNEVGIK